MNLPDFSVRRPVFTTMFTLMTMLIGIVALTRLRIDMLPAVELPRLSVRTGYEGASPEVVERLITQILEEIVAAVPGVEEMTSSSREGRSDIRVTFGWGTDLDVAAQDVQSRIDDELSELPEQVVRPQIRKFDIASFPVVLLGVSSALDPVQLTEIVEKQIRNRFARLPGVAQVDLWGGYPREVRIELDPARLNALRLPLDVVTSAIQDANLDLPAGTIERGRYEVTLRAPAEFASLDDINDTVVAIRDGTPVRLGQISKVLDTYERRTRIVRINGETGIRVAIRKQGEANTVEVANAILAEIDAVNRDMPQIEVVPVSNQGNFIERSIENVARSVLYGGGFAVLVLLLFLRSIRSTAVVALAIPISAIATFALVYLAGFTLNLMTLGGLALGVGMMVDSSIVVLENIFRRQREDGEVARVAAVRGAVEVAPAILASTITTLVIFLPVVFVRGAVGLLFQELALVIVFSLCCALLVALTVLPMLAATLLRPPGAVDKTPAKARGLDALYGRLIRGALENRGLTVLAAVALLGASLTLLPAIGTEFLPPSDESEVRVTAEMELGTRVDIVDRQAHLVEDAVTAAVPEARAVIVSVEGGTQDSAEAQVTVSLVSPAERERSNAAIADDLRELLAGNVAGAVVRTRARQGQFLLQRLLGSGQEGLEVEIRGFEFDVLDVLSRQVVEVVAGTPGITDVDISREKGIPQQMLLVDRNKAADVGLTVRDVAEALETAVAGRRAGDYRVDGNSYRILVQLQDVDRLTLDEILDLTLSTPTGDDVALRSVLDDRAGRGPVQIDRKGQQRVVSVTANVSGRLLGTVAAEIETQLDEIPRPVGYSLGVAGGYEAQEKAFGELLVSLLLAILLVYMALACQYESLRDPIIVMAAVPFAAIGVIVTLVLTNTTLNVQSAIGTIMLGGIVVNNAILLVDQANRLAADRPLGEAIAEAGRRRLRPILMTTSTTVLGLLPLAIGIGEGSEAQAPLARTVIGGLLASTVITLVLIPAAYSLVWSRRHRNRSEATAQIAAAAAGGPNG